MIEKYTIHNGQANRCAPPLHSSPISSRQVIYNRETEALIISLEVFETGGLKDPSGWPMPKWTPDLDTSFSKDQSVETSILSVTAPGPQILKGTAAVRLARQINEYGASLAAKDPSKYGFFAAIPDPCEDMNAVIEKIRYSLKTLKADGITLYSRYGGDNHYLGHPDLRPLWEELEKHQAIVFVHPTHTVDTNLVNPHLPMV